MAYYAFPSMVVLVEEAQSSMINSRLKGILAVLGVSLSLICISLLFLHVVAVFPAVSCNTSGWLLLDHVYTLLTWLLRCSMTPALSWAQLTLIWLPASMKPWARAPHQAAAAAVNAFSLCLW